MTPAGSLAALRDGWPEALESLFGRHVPDRLQEPERLDVTAAGRLVYHRGDSSWFWEPAIMGWVTFSRGPRPR